MKEDNFSKLSLDELIIMKKHIVESLIAFVIIMILGATTCLYLAIKHKDYTKLAFLGILTLTFPPNYLSLNNIKKEIKFRNINQP
jgi:hypothetical protein